MNRPASPFYLEQGGSVCSWGETSARPRCPCPQGPHPGVTLSFPLRADCSISTAFSCAADTSGEGNATRAALASFVSEGKWLSCAGDAVTPPCPPPRVEYKPFRCWNKAHSSGSRTQLSSSCRWGCPRGGPSPCTALGNKIFKCHWRAFNQGEEEQIGVGCFWTIFPTRQAGPSHLWCWDLACNRDEREGIKTLRGGKGQTLPRRSSGVPTWRRRDAPASAVEVGTGRAGPGGAVSTSAPPRARRLVELQGKN